MSVQIVPQSLIPKSPGTETVSNPEPPTDTRSARVHCVPFLPDGPGRVRAPVRDSTVPLYGQRYSRSSDLQVVPTETYEGPF